MNYDADKPFLPEWKDFLRVNDDDFRNLRGLEDRLAFVGHTLDSVIWVMGKLIAERDATLVSQDTDK
jgi:hypothetical protein